MILPATDYNIEKAADLLRQAKLIAFPTETVYGLGANVFSPEAVAKIFEVKARPLFDPLIVHLADSKQLKDVANVDNEKLQQKVKALSVFWPGPLTLVLPANPSVPTLVRADLPSVAVRIPNHSVALKLIQSCGFPLAAPSANPFSYVSPTRAEHVEEHLGNYIEFTLDGGACQVGIESTILSLLDEAATILRPGAITLEMLRPILGEVSYQTSVSSNKPIAPGQLKTHYAPRTPMAFASDKSALFEKSRIGLISFQKPQGLTQKFEVLRCLSDRGDLQSIGQKLFDTIRELDKLGLDLILIDTCKEQDFGVAIMDRLRRACAKSSVGS